MLAYIVLLLILVLFVAFIFLVLKQNSKAKVNRSLAAMIICVGIWATAIFFENEVPIISLAKFLLYIDFIFALISGLFFLRFCLYFTASNKFLKYLKYGDAIVVLISCAIAGGLILYNVRFENKVIVYDIGYLYFIYAILLIFYILYGSYVLFAKYLKTAGIYKLQLIYILLGLFISGVTPLIVNLIFPILGITDINISRLGIYGLIFFVGFTTYAILRYRLMDIRVIIRRSAVFTVLVLLITALYAILAYFLSQIFTEIFGVQSLLLNGIVMAILVAIGFEPLKKWLSFTTDRYLFKAPYNPQQVLGEFSEKLTSTLDLKFLSEFIVTKLGLVFKPAYVSLFLLDEKNSQYERQAVAGKPIATLQVIDKKLFNNIYNYLKQNKQERNVFVREEIKKLNEQVNNPILDTFYNELEKYGVNLQVPLYSQDKLVGILFFGDKKSGDVYSDEDIRMTEIIAGQSAVAIQNAKLFEEQKHFAAHLKVEVDKATKELKIANIQLKKLDVAKSEFISIASHQLRTPLTVIKGYVSMIQQGDFGKVPDSIIGPCDKIFKSTMRIIGLVEDLLNISRIESGRMKFDFEDVNLSDLVQDVFEELEQHAKNRGLEFTFIKPAKKIPLLKLDRNKIREVLMNLMDNAVKYTEKGWVKVQLEKLDNHIRYSVSDSGRGLEPDEMPLLFQKFSRAKGVQLVHTEGTGLGLYIAKKILQKHHAKIWAESEGAGKGSTFIIEFKV